MNNDAKIKYFKWLLEKLDEEFYYQIYYKKVRPAIWGVGI